MIPTSFPTFHKAVVTVASMVGQRQVVKLAYPLTDVVSHYDMSTYPDVKGLIALTIDDALCRQQDAYHCMAKEVGQLLAKFSAKATFFLTTDFVTFHTDEMVRLLREGHEVANHCPQDRPYDSEDEACFSKALLDAEGICDELRKTAALPARPRRKDDWWRLLARSCGTFCSPAARRGCPQGAPPAEAGGRTAPQRQQRWFRPPAARCSSTMFTVLKRENFKVVLGDCYANDAWISDPDFIARTMLQHAHDGSVMVIHMPERGFREYTFEALRLVLEGLQERSMKVTTLNDLHEAATAGRPKM